MLLTTIRRRGARCVDQWEVAVEALEGLRVVDLSNVRTGAQVSQLLADFGADVVHVEPPGGSPLRREAAWPCWARGKRSIQLDLHDPDDVAVVRGLAATSDVVLETFRPGVADRLGLGYDELSRRNERLVYASITGFGRRGPLVDLQGYEGVVLAKFGAMWALENMSERDGPSFPSVAMASYPASQLCAQGILAALYERERSGRGQWVETSLAQALSIHDNFALLQRMLASRYDGFVHVARVQRGIPSGGLSFRLLVALTADGRWVQFSQTVERLFRAMMKMFELDWMFDDPRWRSAPDFDDVEQRVEFWEILLQAARKKTLDEWRAEFDRDPNVWAELFRHGYELLDHPQMQWNRMVAEVDDPERGRVRQPGPLARLEQAPAALDRPAPRLGEHDDAIRAEASASAPPTGRTAGHGTPVADVDRRPPLDGVTVVELGSYYAAPFGATLLADLGARVIKLEELSGDPFRMMVGFPDLAAIKVLQGKECVAVDLQSEEGRRIAHRIIAGADIVLQSFRAGVAERLGLDPDTLRRLNPDLVYLRSPGYGPDGPCGHRPAFAPTIGAAAGLASRNAGASIPEGPDLALEEIKPAAMRLATAVMGVGNADGFSAVSAGTAMLLGLVARQRGAGAQTMLTTMLSSAAHALSEVMVDYAGKPPVATADAGLHGFSALYRLYAASEGWVFLAAPSDRDWARLVDALPGDAGLRDDVRFVTAEGRRAHDEALAEVLGAHFATRPAGEWESELRAAGVACVEASQAPVEAHYLDEGSPGRESGFLTTAQHPVLDEIPRMAPVVELSRSTTVAGNAGRIGEHTAKVLLEVGYTDAEVARLAEEGVIAVVS